MKVHISYHMGVKSSVTLFSNHRQVNGGIIDINMYPHIKNLIEIILHDNKILRKSLHFIN